MSKRILLTANGSLGDVYPFIAIGSGLRARGHDVTIATNRSYRGKIEKAGLRFAPMGPHLTLETSEEFRKILDPRKGPEYLFRELLYPSVPEVYREVMDALDQADVIVTYPIAFAAQIAAERSGLPWVSTVPTPAVFDLRDDSPQLAPLRFIGRFRGLGRLARALDIKIRRTILMNWARPVRKFRSSLGLSQGRDPLFEGQDSPQLVLAMFSPILRDPQAYWPPNMVVTGFPFCSPTAEQQELDSGLDRFLEEGPAPVVFTLGSSAALVPGAFFEETFSAIRHLGCRAVVITEKNSIKAPVPANTLTIPYAPFSKLFPRASVIVNHGGIGTGALALAAGRPMLVVPYAYDMFGNAECFRRLGVARVISRLEYVSARVSSELECLQSDSSYSISAAHIARTLSGEDGVRSACDAIENVHS